MERQRGERSPRYDSFVDVTHIGGIDRTTVALPRGTTVLSGRNATNRTSFLRAVMAALGSDRPSMKADAEEGSVELRIDDESYTRTYRRTDHGVVTGGRPYLDDAEEADLFSFLLGDNEARRAVEMGEGLRSVMMRPVDTAQIESEITRLQAERDEIDRQLQEMGELRTTVDELRGERARIADRLAEIDTELDRLDAPVATETIGDRFGTLLERIQAARITREDTRFELATERQRLNALREERGGLTDELAEIRDVPDHELEAMGARIDELRDRRTSLEVEIKQLGTVTEFNERLLDEDAPEQALDLGDGRRVGRNGEGITCWTCGTDVTPGDIRTTISYLDELRQERVDEHANVTSNLRAIEAERDEARRQRRARETLESDIEEIDTEIDRIRERIETLERTIDEREDEIAELEREITAREQDEYEEVLDAHATRNTLVVERHRLRNRRARLEADLETMEDDLARLPELRERRERIEDNLAELDTRVDRIEAEAIEAFNEHMATLLELLEYENITRVWIERRDRPGDEDAEFVHHVVRTSDDGTTYEDTVEHLSESERAVMGLVFALAGYLVHELHERVPFMLLDSLEAIDADRIAALVEYFSAYAEFLVVALLPEDASALEEDAVNVIDVGDGSM